MTYANLIKYIKTAAMSSRLVGSFNEGDVYDVLNKQNIKYGNVCCALLNITIGDCTSTYNIMLYYADRLITDDSNKINIWDAAHTVIKHIVNKLEDEYEIEGYPVVTPFEQQFADKLAGAYCTISIICEFDACGLEANDYVEPSDDEEEPDEPNNEEDEPFTE